MDGLPGDDGEGSRPEVEVAGHRLRILLVAVAGDRAELHVEGVHSVERGACGASLRGGAQGFDGLLG